MRRMAQSGGRLGTTLPAGLVASKREGGRGEARYHVESVQEHQLGLREQREGVGQGVERRRAGL